VTHDVFTRFIDELPGPGRLGRHVEHDDRSLAYLVTPASATLVSKTWDRATPILDQGDLGSCTGNAAAGCLGTEPFDVASVALDETEAVLYGEATTLDTVSGQYPPTDTGSTGLAVAKACKNDGLIAGYQHATSIDIALATIAGTAPVITGINWYTGFDSPDADGRVTIGKRDTIRGGHEFLVRGVDVENELVHADNSWGASWGAAGSFSFSFAHWERLLGKDGDVTVFAPLSGPAPTPTPTPTPTADAVFDKALASFWKAEKLWKANR
jgi:hypothetical protein